MFNSFFFVYDHFFTDEIRVSHIHTHIWWISFWEKYVIDIQITFGDSGKNSLFIDEVSVEKKKPATFFNR